MSNTHGILKFTKNFNVTCPVLARHSNQTRCMRVTGNHSVINFWVLLTNAWGTG